MAKSNPPGLRFLGGYFTEQALAHELGRSVRSLKRWRAEGLGPPFTRIGRTAVYRVEAVRDWIRSHEKQMPRESGRSAKEHRSSARAEKGQRA